MSQEAYTREQYDRDRRVVGIILLALIIGSGLIMSMPFLAPVSGIIGLGVIVTAIGTVMYLIGCQKKFFSQNPTQ
jgi:hypothetical protein